MSTNDLPKGRRATSIAVSVTVKTTARLGAERLCLFNPVVGCPKGLMKLAMDERESIGWTLIVTTAAW